MGAVILKNLVKRYAEKGSAGVRAVNGIDLTVHDGEFMVLVGPSGCGKSTTLRMIAGLEEISEGTISIDGQTVNHVPPKNRDIAMVFQNYALYPHLSVYDNMAFGLKLRKFAPAEIDVRVREAAAMLGIANVLDRRPKALSGGQRQRVAVGRAIVRKPKVFLFDEPLSNLDAKMRASTRIEISRLHARLRATMIYVTHDQVEAMTMGDRICVMKDGDILQVDAPLDLYHRPRTLFVAGFIGSPPMNFFRGKIEATGERLNFVETAGTQRGIIVPLNGRENLGRVRAYAGREVVLGVRPEDIRGAAQVGVESPEQGFEAPIEGVETMGAEIHLHLSTQSGTCIARVPPHTVSPADGVFSFTFAPDKLHLFDAVTEQVID